MYDALREIIRVGTSAGGAQAKAVVGWNRETGDFLAGTGDLPEGYEHWLIKFTPKGMEDAGEKEYEVSRRALACERRNIDRIVLWRSSRSERRKFQVRAL